MVVSSAIAIYLNMVSKVQVERALRKSLAFFHACLSAHEIVSKSLWSLCECY